MFQKSNIALFMVGAAGLGLIAAPLIVDARAGEAVTISQKGRAYAPRAVTLKTGQELTILNDDMFVHHAFVDHPDKVYDSGSMDEGESRSLWFETPGDYTVLCAIHPKMRLKVTVK